MISRILAAIALIALGACSSGGGSDTDPPATPPPSSTPTPGSLQFVLDSVTVNETAGIAAVQVERSGGQDGIVTADVVFIAQSAGISDVSLDVTAVSFGDGDNAAKDVAFTVIDDSETEGNETFAIELGNPGGGATLGAVASAAITIVDNDSVAPTPSAGFAINDTGVSLCATGLETGIACDAAGATSDYPGQDAERGRDPQSSDDTDGKLGFVFTQLDASGAPLGAPSQDYAAAPWTCVRDEVTGLIWEVKTDDAAAGDADWRYTWYQAATGEGEEDGGDCAATDRCDTAKYVEDTNAAALCGYTDWRLPTALELISLVDYESDGPVAIDARFFPNTQPALYWAADRGAIPNQAPYVGFTYGESRSITHNRPLAVRLVRGGQPL